MRNAARRRDLVLGSPDLVRVIASFLFSAIISDPLEEKEKAPDTVKLRAEVSQALSREMSEMALSVGASRL